MIRNHCWNVQRKFTIWLPWVTELSMEGENTSPEKRTSPSLLPSSRSAHLFRRSCRRAVNWVTSIVSGGWEDIFCGVTRYASLKCKIDKIEFMFSQERWMRTTYHSPMSPSPRRPHLAPLAWQARIVVVLVKDPEIELRNPTQTRIEIGNNRKECLTFVPRSSTFWEGRFFERMMVISWCRRDPGK